MGDTSIEWTDATWNPVTGCSKVSPGCAHCYAETVAERFWLKQYRPIVPLASCNGTVIATGPARPRQFTDVLTHEDRLDQPLRWRKPKRVFVNSMSDLFHEDVPDAFIDRVFAVMALASQHTFQVLTKRADRMRAYVSSRQRDRGKPHQAVIGTELGDGGHYSLPWPLANVWLGVSVENQHFADERIPLLLQTPAAVRFLSCEPLLGPLNIIQFLSDKYISVGGRQWIGAGGIRWVIFGGESGTGARPMDLQWVRSGIRQCRDAGVSPFVKQLGARAYGPDTHSAILRDRKGGDPAEWPADLRVRELPL